MRWLDQALLPAAAVTVTAAAAGVANAVLSRRAAGRDRDAVWLRLAVESGIALGLASIVSGCLENLDAALWQRGWHAHFDLVPDRLGVRFGYVAALALPFAVWSFLLFVNVATARRPSSAAGSGLARPHTWVLLMTAPLVAAVVFAVPRLGGGPGAYPAFSWSTLVVVLVSLVAFAFPGRAVPPVARPAALAVTHPSLGPIAWPQALRAAGIETTSLAAWPSRAGRREDRAPRPSDLAARLARLGARRVPAPLVEAVDALLAGERGIGEHGKALVVFGAEDGGGGEVAATAAAITAERFLRRTLVVCRRGAGALAADFARFLPRGDVQVATLDRPGEIDRRRPIWVVSAEAFVESILPRLADRELAAAMRLVVWWDLHRFSGVPAANLWAASHRLYRLLAHLGGGDVRTLAFSWRSQHPSAQVERYVQRLFPHTEDRRELHLEPSWPRATELHQIGSSAGFFRLDPTLAAGRIHPLAATAKVSLDAGWPTHLSLPPAAAMAMSRHFDPLVDGGLQLGDALAPRPADAAVRLLALAPAEALALPEFAGELGRAASWEGKQHVGVITDNPYVDHLLHDLKSHPGGVPTTSRRLVAAVGQGAILRRHLLRALAELPATGSELRRDFLAHETALESALAELYANRELDRQDIRFLDDDGRLARDFFYGSLRATDSRPLPFDSAGGELIEVRDATAATEAGGVVLRLDVERLLIRAYPHCIFTNAGKRYRVREWDSLEELARRRSVDCELQALPLTSVRIRRSTLQRLPERNGTTIGPPARGLARQLARVVYQELVDGALLLGREPSGQVTAEALTLPRSLPLQLATSALLLHFPASVGGRELAALAEALRPLLPVHLGVDEDDLEVVAFGGSGAAPGSPRGVALVELYPDDLGLLDPIAEDSDFLLDLLRRAQGWLAGCRCEGEGCQRCLRAPAARATNGGRPVSGAMALAALARVLG
jgi:uncharacterized protein DUF1998